MKRNSMFSLFEMNKLTVYFILYICFSLLTAGPAELIDSVTGDLKLFWWIDLD